MSSTPLNLSLTHATRPRSPLFRLTGLLCAIVVFIGFAPTFYLRWLSDRPPLSLTAQLHGLAFTLWILLFLGQGWLIRLRRPDLHRIVGMGGAVLAVAMVYLAMAVAIPRAHEYMLSGHRPLGFSPEQFLFVQVGDMLTFSVFVGTAIALRRHPEAHKRLMLLATLGIIAPAIGRMPVPPVVKFAGPMLVVLGCMGYELARHRKIHPALLWGGMWFIVDAPLRIAIGATAAWATVAHWIVA